MLGTSRLRSIEKHPDDATSLAVLLQDMSNSDNDGCRSVLYCKFQGQKCSDDKLKEKDFPFVIQSPFQREMFQAFSHNRVVCMDATHGTNAYTHHSACHR